MNGFTAGFAVVLRCSTIVGEVLARAAGLLEWGRLLAAETADVDPKTSRAARATLVTGSMRMLPLQRPLWGKTVTSLLNSLPTKDVSCSLRSNCRSFFISRPVQHPMARRTAARGFE